MSGKGADGAIAAIIFDMDGLLLDSEVYWEEARREYCESVGCDWSPEDEGSVKGNNSAEWAEAIRRRCRGAAAPDAIIAAVSARMKALYIERLPLLPGATSVVRLLARTYPLAIASSSPPSIIEFAMTEACIRDCFSVVVSADHAGRGKPAPDVFLLAAERLERRPEACAVFEDSTAGIAAARAAGMFVLAVPNPRHPPSAEALTQADVVLPSLEAFEIDLLPA